MPKFLILTIVLLLTACGRNHDPAMTGYVEGELLMVAAERAGRLSKVTANEGDEVRQGEILFELESDQTLARHAQASARLDEARARLSDAEAAQQRPADIAVLEAAMRRAAAAATYSRREFERQAALAASGFASRARLDATRAALDRDVAELAEAERRIVQARQPRREAEIAAATAALGEARAAKREADLELDRTAVRSPASGRVEEMYFRAGEVVSAGQPVLSVFPPDRVRVRFFVPEKLLAKIRIGGIVAVSCDSCPGNLRARVRFIARQAEFTPPIILSRGDRDRLVFLVEAEPLQGARLLVAGQPVDVALPS